MPRFGLSDRRLKALRAASTATRELLSGSGASIRDTEPAAALRAAGDLEQAARSIACRHIRRAREAGHTWHDIGTALDLTPSPGRTIADAAFAYAASDPDAPYPGMHGHCIIWTCPSCDHVIADFGLADSPAGNERNHTACCPRFQATIAAWNAEWEPEAGT